MRRCTIVISNCFSLTSHLIASKGSNILCTSDKIKISWMFCICIEAKIKLMIWKSVWGRCDGQISNPTTWALESKVWENLQGILNYKVGLGSPYDTWYLVSYENKQQAIIRKPNPKQIASNFVKLTSLWFIILYKAPTYNLPKMIFYAK